MLRVPSSLPRSYPWAFTGHHGTARTILSCSYAEILAALCVVALNSNLLSFNPIFILHLSPQDLLSCLVSTITQHEASSKRLWVVSSVTPIFRGVLLRLPRHSTVIYAPSSSATLSLRSHSHHACTIEEDSRTITIVIQGLNLLCPIP